jgi:drug/metabolite transporter (DMT)-like permease
MIGDQKAGANFRYAVSQFIGFFFYYKGLALGGVAKMSQVQLLLPFLAIFAAHIILGEAIDGSVVVGTLAITAIVVAGRKSTKTQKDRREFEQKEAKERKGWMGC